MDREKMIRLITEIKLRHLLDMMWSDLVEMKKDYDKKDTLLALCGPVRPEVRKALLKRRRKQLSSPKYKAMHRSYLTPSPRRSCESMNPMMRLQGGGQKYGETKYTLGVTMLLRPRRNWPGQNREVLACHNRLQSPSTLATAASLERPDVCVHDTTARWVNAVVVQRMLLFPILRLLPILSCIITTDRLRTAFSK